MAAWESASGLSLYDYFKFDIYNTIATYPAGVIYNTPIPTDLYPYIVNNGTRQTAVTITSPKSLANGFTNNIISFDAATFNNCSGWSAFNRSVLLMPLNCSRAKIVANGTIASDGTAKTIGIYIEDLYRNRVGENVF